MLLNSVLLIAMQPMGKINEYRNQLAECPRWHPAENSLYWTDVSAEQLLRYHPDDGVEVVCDDVVVGGFTIQRDGSLLLFMDEGTVGHYRDGKVVKDILSLPEVNTRFNDVTADPDGRVLCGTMPGKDHPGHLYRLDTDGSFERLLTRVQVPNGLGFSCDFDRLYFTETNNQIIHAFEYDRETGKIANRRTFADFRQSSGKPDGIAVDTDGNVWSAQWGANSVVCLNTDGEQIDQIDVSAQYVTSITFGQPEQDRLYITTAQASEPNVDDGGRIFTAEPGSTGMDLRHSQIHV